MRLDAGFDELGQRLVVVGLAGVAVFEALQQLLSLLLLADGPIGQLVAIVQRLADRGPEQLLLDGLVL
jgi:hypothetical protein